MYIRTKDKIIAFGEKYAYPTRLSNGKTYFSFQELTEDRFEVMKEYNHWEILKQSDTIEELCDEFVGLIKDRSSDFIITKVIAHNLKELKDSLKTEFNGKTYQSKFDIIYGAIWTSKGLIYVAKMNDKGELELI